MLRTYLCIYFSFSIFYSTFKLKFLVEKIRAAPLLKKKFLRYGLKYEIRVNDSLKVNVVKKLELSAYHNYSYFSFNQLRPVTRVERGSNFDGSDK